MGREVTDQTGVFPRQPRARRAATLLVVKCHRQDGGHATLRVQNLSATGLKGESPDIGDFALNEAVSIHFRNLAPVAARVIWYEGSEIGLKFDNPVDLEQLSHARTMATKPAGIARSSAPGH